MANRLCKDAEAVVVITNKTPRDSTAFLAQRDFILGLTERFIRRNTNLSLFVFDHKLPGEFLFQSSFRNMTIQDFSPTMLHARAKEMIKVRSAADFFSLDNQSPVKPSKNLLPTLIVAIDVLLPLSFYQMGGEYPVPKHIAITDWAVFYRAYEIFTHGWRSFKTNRRFSKRKYRNSLDEIGSARFQNIRNFQYNFKTLYKEMCRMAVTMPNALGKSKFHWDFGASVFSMSLEISKNFDYKIITKAAQYHWMFVADFGYVRKKARGYNLAKAKRTCSKDGMSLLTVKNSKEAQTYGKHLRYLRRMTEFRHLPIRFDEVTFIIGLTRREETGGSPFRWVNGKDLSFSYWGDEEPRGGDKRGCAHWRINNTNWDDNGWGSAGCGNTGGIVFCHVELPRKKEVLSITNDEGIYSMDPNEKKMKPFGEIHISGIGEYSMKTSMSLAIASGFLQQQIQKNVNLLIEGLVDKEQVSVSQRGRGFIKKLASLFYSCDRDNSSHGVPWSQICDGVRDCSSGADEFICHPLRPQFVPLWSLCDGRKDCSQGEDELDCDVTCSPGFICLSGSISATRFTNTQSPPQWSFVDPRTIYLDISGVPVPDFFQKYPSGHFTRVLLLKMSRCGVNDISHGREFLKLCENKRRLKDFERVQGFDLSYNNLLRIENCSLLRFMRGLRKLNLSHNENLTEIGALTFQDLWKLRVLDLGYTKINNLHEGTFSKLQNLERLVLRQTHISSVDFILPGSLRFFNIERTNVISVSKYVFTTFAMSVKEIRSSTYKLCCPQVLGPLIPWHACYFPDNEVVISCEDLVRERPLRALLWMVGLATLFGNIITLLYRLVWDRKLLLKPYGLFVTNLGLSDTLMGLYLMIISIADLRFQGEYVFHDHSWKNSQACWTAGTVATMSSITSTLFIFLITVDRFLVVRYPFGDVRFSTWTMTGVVISAWFFGISLAILPLLPFAQDWVVYSHSGMCVGLPLRPNRLPGWQYSVSLFVVLNFLLFLFIGVGQGAIYKNMKEKVQRTTKSVSIQSQLYQNQRRQEIAIAKQLSLVVMSNFICWFPIIVLGLLTLSGRDVGEAAYRWTAIVVLPINSALNPLLYTVPAVKKKLSEFITTRKSTKASFKIEKNKEASPAPTCVFKDLWSRTIRNLKLLIRALEQNDSQGFVGVSELETVYRNLRHLREAF
ncbi:relaxin receptor-like protein [Elysia marginata]|uniref:Relaxin receptor-like protein n=1 Tax=Elysia marginata TaxID=1093978 RepID=A0AAV4ECL1_9GAST|nr:relaxin receptor-like protein [Elysia marginata]